MDEFWVCQHCRSLNRAGAGKCYSCRNKYGSRAADAPAVIKPSAAPPPPVEQIPDFGRAPVPPSPVPQVPTYTRPVALAPAASAAAVRPPRGGTGLNPVGAVRLRIARSLATRQSVSVAWLGYLTVALLAVILAIGSAILMTVLPVAVHLLQHADPAAAWAQLASNQRAFLKSLSIVFLAIGALTLACFSLFIGLTTHNATGLGAGQPLLSPYRAGTCWAGVLWTQARIAVGLIVPAALIWRGYTIPGLLAAIVAVEIAHHHVDDAGGWLSRPYRHLPDLYAKLGVDAGVSSPMAAIWSASFRIANALFIVVCALPMLALVVVTATTMAGRSDLVSWQSSGFGAAQLAVALLVSSLIGWTAIALSLLVPITVGLVGRQRTRKTLVRVGRARSWVARPGEGGYSSTAGTQAAQYGEIDDEDRIVERRPGYGAPPSGEPGFGGPVYEDPRFDGGGLIGSSGPGFGGPPQGGSGFGAPSQGGPFGGSGSRGPGLGGPGVGGPGQASLYSPSTTSSFPWSDEPPAEPD